MNSIFLLSTCCWFTCLHIFFSWNRFFISGQGTEPPLVCFHIFVRMIRSYLCIIWKIGRRHISRTWAQNKLTPDFDYIGLIISSKTLYIYIYNVGLLYQLIWELMDFFILKMIFPLTRSYQTHTHTHFFSLSLFLFVLWLQFIGNLFSNYLKWSI